MPNVRADLLRGADEDPAADPVPEDEQATTGPRPVEGLPQAVNGDGRASARQLQNWLNGGRLGSDRSYVGTSKGAWGALRRSPGALEVARQQGYLQFVCRTHRMIHCRECACPSCGAPGGCNCGARQVDSHHLHTNPLPRSPDGTRRNSVELEVMFMSASVLQQALGEYPYAFSDSTVNSSQAPGWYDGCEFKLTTLATDKHRTMISDVVDRIHSIGGVGAPRNCGYHVHVERKPDDREARLMDRWLEVEDEMFGLFPTRIHSQWCQSVRANGGLSGHYTVLNASDRHPTWELRIHPGTTSWVVATAWTAWVHGFISGNGSTVGEAYLDARRAAKAVTNGASCHPWAWRRAIERWHRANGQDYQRTFAAVAEGQFSRFQSEARLRAYLADRGMRQA